MKTVNIDKKTSSPLPIFISSMKFSGNMCLMIIEIIEIPEVVQKI